MSLKKYYFDKNIENCYTCMFIDEYACNISDEGEMPSGYDATAVCCKYDDKQPENIENRLFVSTCWNACSKYKRCTERQAYYLDIFDYKTQSIIENPHKLYNYN